MGPAKKSMSSRAKNRPSMKRRFQLQQISRSIYLVDDEEIVTIEVQATKVGNFVTFVVDGQFINPVSTTPLTFRFTTSLAPGEEHHGMITCFFPNTAPDDAHFQVLVSGSNGGSRFEGSDIKKSDAGWTRGIQFLRPS